MRTESKRCHAAVLVLLTAAAPALAQAPAAALDATKIDHILFYAELAGRN